MLKENMQNAQTQRNNFLIPICNYNGRMCDIICTSHVRETKKEADKIKIKKLLKYCDEGIFRVNGHLKTRSYLEFIPNEKINNIAAYGYYEGLIVISIEIEGWVEE